MALFSKDSRSSSTYICRYGRFCSLYSFAATQFVIGSFDRRITFETYEKQTGKKLHQMNPSYYDLKALLEVQECLNKVR